MTSDLVPVEIIAKKRNRGELGAPEIEAIVTGCLSGKVSESQMAALLMAIAINGMSSREMADLTLALANSGARLDLSRVPGIKVDKHSTGGVGDKTTLIVAPLVASLGVPVPKLAGRGLGHTGGTIDKLEAIPGLTTDLSPERFVAQVSDIGLAIAAQSAQVVPADKKIYALRDATGTVDSVPLIASSVMSKKLAAGADAIVLDVKTGLGAFATDLDRALQLARAMVDIGTQHGKRMAALVTRMDQPLGAAVGDAVEVAEAVSVLTGLGPQDVNDLCIALAAQMLVLGGAAPSLAEARVLAHGAIQSGAGLAKLRQMVAAQGGDVRAVDEPNLLVAGLDEVAVLPPVAGVVVAANARAIGAAIRELKDSAEEDRHRCGLFLRRKAGDTASADEPIAVLQFPPQARQAAFRAAARVRAAYAMGDRPPPTTNLIAETITA